MTIRALKEGSPSKGCINRDLYDEYTGGRFLLTDYFSRKSLYAGVKLKVKNPLTSLTKPLFLKSIDARKTRCDVFAITPKSHKFSAIANGLVVASVGIGMAMSSFNSVAFAIGAFCALKTVYHGVTSKNMQNRFIEGRSGGFKGFKLENKRAQSLAHP